MLQQEKDQQLEYIKNLENNVVSLKERLGEIEGENESLRMEIKSMEGTGGSRSEESKIEDLKQSTNSRMMHSSQTLKMASKLIQFECDSNEN